MQKLNAEDGLQVSRERGATAPRLGDDEV